MVYPDLSRLRPVTLAQLDSVKLQDRMDTKYVIPYAELQRVIDNISDEYFCLEINGKRSFAYESDYYDTPELKLYYDHHKGKLNRFKVRVRKYVDSGLLFFEIKAKNNKSRTIKSRVPLRNGEDPFNNEAVHVLQGIYRLEQLGLKQRLRVDYSRITLVNKDFTERVTIDTGLKFIADCRVVDKSHLVVVEVKQDRAKGSAFTTLMKKWHVRKMSLSKYCYGVISLFPEVKFNNFKPNTIQYNKITYASATGTGL
jgi:hypothetical protein